MKTFDVRWGILSSSPPTACGIATFTTALGRALERGGENVDLVRIIQDDESATSPLTVVAHLRADDTTSMSEAAWALNRCDVALIQHEYGLYGGSDGDDVVKVMAALRVPAVTILHTVLSAPTDHQRFVLNQVIGLSSCVVVMSNAAQSTLRRLYDVGEVAVRVIPHGAALGLVPFTLSSRKRPILLTWGLIGPGKGIEWAIDAMSNLRDLDPLPLYVVAGRTHPKVLAHEGDRYRTMLEDRVRANRVDDMVCFDNSYRSLSALNSLIFDASVVILPYDSSDQATSGVLVDAIAAGRPVVSTSFPHSREMLASGAGTIVAHRDPRALSQALRRIITNPVAAADMAREARRIAPNLSWDAVAGRYAELAREMLRATSLPVSA